MGAVTAERDAPPRARVVGLEAARPQRRRADASTEELEQQLDATRWSFEQMDQRLGTPTRILAQSRSLQREPDPAAAPREDPHGSELRRSSVRCSKRPGGGGTVRPSSRPTCSRTHGIRSLDRGAEARRHRTGCVGPGSIPLDPELDPGLSDDPSVPLDGSVLRRTGTGPRGRTGDAQEGDKSASVPPGAVGGPQERASATSNHLHPEPRSDVPRPGCAIASADATCPRPGRAGARPRSRSRRPPRRRGASVSVERAASPGVGRDLMRGSSWRPGCPVGLSDLASGRRHLLGVRPAGASRQARGASHGRRGMSPGLFGKLYAARSRYTRMRLDRPVPTPTTSAR